MTTEINLTTDASEKEIRQFIRNAESREQLEEFYAFGTILSEAAHEEIEKRDEQPDDPVGEALADLDPEAGSDADRI